MRNQIIITAWALFGLFSGNTEAGGPPQQAGYHSQAAQLYRDAAAKCPANAACYNQYATYEDCQASRFASGNRPNCGAAPQCTPGPCSAKGASGSISGYSPATAGTGTPPAGVSPETWRNLNPGQKSLITSLGALQSIVANQYAESQREEQAAQAAQDATDRALKFWIPMAKLMQENSVNPEYQEFLADYFANHPGDIAPGSTLNPGWYIESLKAGGARADLAVENTPKDGGELQHLESLFLQWRIDNLIEQRNDAIAASKPLNARERSQLKAMAGNWEGSMTYPPAEQAMYAKDGINIPKEIPLKLHIKLRGRKVSGTVTYEKLILAITNIWFNNEGRIQLEAKDKGVSYPGGHLATTSIRMQAMPAKTELSGTAVTTGQDKSATEYQVSKMNFNWDARKKRR